MENLAEELRRVPPQQIEAEQSLLGGILIDNDGLPSALEILRGDEFYRDNHRIIFQAIQDLFDRNEPVDLITVVDLLNEQNKLESAGGATYVASLVEMVPSSTNVAAYAKIVSEKALLRRLIQGANEILSWCYGKGKSMEEVLDHAERTIFSISENRLRSPYFPITDIVKHSVKYIEEFHSNRSMITGVPTSYVDLDNLTAGFQPSDLIIIAARPSMGKCLSFDSEIVLADGHVATIEEIYRRRCADLLTLKENWKFGFTQPSAFVDDGVKPVYRVTTRLGRVVESTLTHPFLTLDGWRRLEELKPGEKIAVPRKLDVFGTETLCEHEIKLLAYLIGDGCLTKATPEFINGNPLLREEFSCCVQEIAGLKVRLKTSNGTRTPSLHVIGDSEFITLHRKLFGDRLKMAIQARHLSCNKPAQALGVSSSLVSYWTQGVCVPKGETFSRLPILLEIRTEELAPHGLAAISKNSKNPLTLWLQEMGPWGKDARAKTIPPVIFRLTKPQVALFLNRLFATDGWASVLAGGQSQLGYCSVSEKLARQVQHLLLRFGIVAALKKRSVKYNGLQRTAWQLDITEAESIRTFISEIGIFGKEKALAKVEESMARRQDRVNCDLIPVEIRHRVAEAKGNESWGSLARRAGIRGHTNIHVGTRSLSRKRLLALATALNDSTLQEIAESDVYWDEIVSIEAAGYKQVYDLTIPETHNFVANDICVHNTALALSIARNVALDHGIPVGFFSLEMSKEQLAMRLLCAEGRVDSQKIRTGFLGQHECGKLLTAAGHFMDAPIYIDDTPALSTMELRAKARRMMIERGIQMIIVDYLQLMRSHRSTDQREQEISEISRSLKGLAKEINVPVIALSQLNRKVEERQDKRPQLSDLRESGSIEQDADVVAFVYREEMYRPETNDKGIAEILIRKQRNGPTGTVKLAYINSYTRFENLAH